MKKTILTACFMLAMICSNAQTIIFLDRGDIFKSPETDMVVMDKYSFSKLHYTSEKYDTLKKEIVRYDSLLAAKDSSVKQVEGDYKQIVQVKDEQIQDITEAYTAMKNTLQQSIDRQNKLQVDYLKLQQKQNRQRKWRNFFMGTSALFGSILVLAVIH